MTLQKKKIAKRKTGAAITRPKLCIFFETVLMNIVQMTMMMFCLSTLMEKCLSIDGLIVRHHQCHEGLLVMGFFHLVEERKAHVVIRAGLVSAVRLLLLGRRRLFLGSGGGRSSGTTGSRSGDGGSRGAQVAEQRSDVDAIQGLGEECGPVGFDGNAGGLQ